MKTQPIAKWKIIATTALVAFGMVGTGASCTQEETEAVLAGVQIVADELDNNNDEVSFRDWLSSELDD